MLAVSSREVIPHTQTHTLLVKTGSLGQGRLFCCQEGPCSHPQSLAGPDQGFIPKDAEPQLWVPMLWPRKCHIVPWGKRKCPVLSRAVLLSWNHCSWFLAETVLGAQERRLPRGHLGEVSLGSLGGHLPKERTGCGWIMLPYGVSRMSVPG